MDCMTPDDEREGNAPTRRSMFSATSTPGGVAVTGCVGFHQERHWADRPLGFQGAYVAVHRYNLGNFIEESEGSLVKFHTQSDVDLRLAGPL